MRMPFAPCPGSHGVLTGCSACRQYCAAFVHSIQVLPPPVPTRKEPSTLSFPCGHKLHFHQPCTLPGPSTTHALYPQVSRSRHSMDINKLLGWVRDDKYPVTHVTSFPLTQLRGKYGDTGILCLGRAYIRITGRWFLRGLGQITSTCANRVKTKKMVAVSGTCCCEQKEPPTHDPAPLSHYDRPSNMSWCILGHTTCALKNSSQTGSVCFDKAVVVYDSATSAKRRGQMGSKNRTVGKI